MPKSFALRLIGVSVRVRSSAPRPHVRVQHDELERVAQRQEYFADHTAHALLLERERLRRAS